MHHKNLRKILALAAAALLALSACGKGEITTPEGAGTDVTQTTVTDTQTPTVTPAGTEDPAAEGAGEEATETPAEEVKQPTIYDPADFKAAGEVSYEMRDLTAMELVAEIGPGWNLGNTLDATDGKGLAAETSWGNPTTTKEMIDAVCTRGFTTIRIPVTFAKHFGTAPDYTIDSEWMDRVQEVVDYAYEDGMFVILDTHHEELWRKPDAEHIEEVSDINKALWTQIAERFADYGDHLIFDGLNEPRLKGSANEWNGGDKEGREYINRLNREFVEAVRATGGKNEKRLLLITSYASSSNLQAMNGVELIEDDDHIGVSIHAYTPYNFTYKSDSSIDHWSGGLNYELDTLFSNLRAKFTKKGVPVLLTEYGAVNKENDEAVAAWAGYYNKLAAESGIPTVWWDNGVYRGSGELFGIFNRKQLRWYRDEVIDAIMEAWTAEE